MTRSSDFVHQGNLHARLSNSNKISENHPLYDYISTHSLGQFDELEFLELLSTSFSLGISEKKHVIRSIPSLNQAKIQELIEVFKEERIEFEELKSTDSEAIESISILEEQKKIEWAFLDKLYGKLSEDVGIELKDFLSYHPLSNFDELEFLDLLRRSYSLNISEKKNVIDSVPILNQSQIDQLYQVFKDERAKVDELRLVEGNEVSLLEEHRVAEWAALNNLYLSEVLERQQVNKHSMHSHPTETEIRSIETFLTPYNAEIIKQLAKKPEDMYRLAPRQFEVLIAEILNDMGWDIELTPESKDGGRDIIASMPLGTSRLLAIVECKRYSPERKVGLDIVERFIYTIREKDKANIGFLATLHKVHGMLLRLTNGNYSYMTLSIYATYLKIMDIISRIIEPACGCIQDQMKNDRKYSRLFGGSN